MVTLYLNLIFSNKFNCKHAHVTSQYLKVHFKHNKPWCRPLLMEFEKLKFSHCLAWLALYLTVRGGIDQLFLEIIKSYVDKFYFFYYADNLKVSTIVSINFIFENSSKSW